MNKFIEEVVEMFDGKIKQIKRKNIMAEYKKNYLGNAKETILNEGTNSEYTIIEVKLNMHQIEDRFVFQGQKGSYLDLKITRMKSTDKYGNTHSVFYREKISD